MKRAAVCSGILHLITLIVMIIGITDPFSRTLQDQHPLMIDFVDISEITKAPIISPMDVIDPEPVMETLQQEPEPTPQPVTAEQPPVVPASIPEPTPPEPPIEPQKPEPKPEPTPIPAPEPKPIPAPKPEPLPKEQPKLEPTPEPAPKKKEIKKPEPPKKEKAEVNLNKEQPKPKVNKDQEKKKIDDAFDNLLADVTKETKKKDSQKTSGRVKGAPAEQEGEIVTASEIDAIRRLMQRCWIVPNGVRGVRNLQVKLKLNITKDGTVKNARIIDRSRMGSDAVFRAAAESAERAIMDPSCNPLPLNPAKYKQWQTMIMTFDPADMQ